MQEKDFDKIEVRNNTCIHMFGYENKFVFPIYVSNQKLEESIDLLLLIHDDKSHYVYIKNFSRFTFHKTKNLKKNGFVEVVYNVKEDCLSINGVKSVKVEEGTIKFKN